MHTIFDIGIIFLLAATLQAQDSARAVIVSVKVGETIDRDERNRFLLFRNVPDFQSGVFYLLPDGRYVARIARGNADVPRDTIIEYREPYLRMMAEQINHFEELQRERYRMGSDPATLLLGRTVPLAETGARIDTTPRIADVPPAPTIHGDSMPPINRPWRLRPRPPRLGALTRPDSGLEAITSYSREVNRSPLPSSAESVRTPIDTTEVAVDPMRLMRRVTILLAGDFGALSYDRFLSPTVYRAWPTHLQYANSIGTWLGLDLGCNIPLLAFNEKGAGLLLRPHIGYARPALHGGMDVLLHANNANLYLLAGLNVQKMSANFGGSIWDTHMVLDQTKLRDMLYLNLGIGFFQRMSFYEFQWRSTLGTPLYSIPMEKVGDDWVDAPPSNYRGFGTVLFRAGWAF